MNTTTPAPAPAAPALASVPIPRVPIAPAAAPAPPPATEIILAVVQRSVTAKDGMLLWELHKPPPTAAAPNTPGMDPQQPDPTFFTKIEKFVPTEDGGVAVFAYPLDGSEMQRSGSAVLVELAALTIEQIVTIGSIARIRELQAQFEQALFEPEPEEEEEEEETPNPPAG